MNKFQLRIRTQLMVKNQLVLSQLKKEHEEQLLGQDTVRLQLNHQMHCKLERITAALDRLEHGEFGKCLRCKQEIDQARLEAYPEAELCIHCQQLIERKHIQANAYAYA